MSIQIYDFLDESILLDQDSLPGGASAVSDERLRAELEAYRSHVLRNLGEIRESLRPRSDGPKAFVATASRTTVNRATLRHMALYFDRAIIDDPLLPLSRSRSSGALSEFLRAGPPEEPLNRRALADAVRFLNAVRPMVRGGFLAIVPTGLANETPRELPLLYSPTQFEERVPPPLRDWFRNRVRVVKLERTDRGWVSGDEPLVPCRAIGITFDGLDQAMMFQLARTTATGDEDDPTHFTFLMDRDAEPPAPDEFGVWVRQSVNQFAGNIYSSIARDVTNAASVQAMLLTDSKLMVDLLSHGGRPFGIDAQIAELVLQLQLPVLDGISEGDLMRVRSDKPDAFEAFRIHLERGLSSIGEERDEAARQRQLEDLRHELTLRTREAELAFKRLRKAMAKDVSLGAISLAASYFTHGVSAVVAFGAAKDAIKRWNEFQASVQSTPGHFLFRLQQATKTSTH